MTAADEFEPLVTPAAGVRWRALVGGPADGDPVIVVHGFAATAEVAAPVARLLARRFRVLVPDLPGFGHSEAPTGVLDIGAIGDALSGWMAAVGVPRAVLVGNSMGCQVLAHLAARHPERCRALVLQGPTVDAGARTAARQAVRLLRDARHERISLWPLLARGLAQAGPSTLARVLGAMLADRIEDVIGGTGCPVLVVRGSRDAVAPQRWVECVTRRAPLGELRVVPGAGHCMVHSAPRALSRVVEGFVDGLNGRG